MVLVENHNYYDISKSTFQKGPPTSGKGGGGAGGGLEEWCGNHKLQCGLIEDQGLRLMPLWKGGGVTPHRLLGVTIEIPKWKWMY
jgi:hypothetical protein